jgi:hypothetical protein
MTHPHDTDAMIDANWQEQVKMDRVRAAAPEMLEALRAALPLIDGYKAGSATVCDAIRAAIAKAEGK